MIMTISLPSNTFKIELLSVYFYIFAQLKHNSLEYFKCATLSKQTSVKQLLALNLIQIIPEPLKDDFF